jgi:uncharacterized protein (TIGR02246 family)
MTFRSMSRLVLAGAVLASVASLYAASGEDNPQLAEVRETLKQFGEAYNKHDAAALGQLWAENAVYSDPLEGLTLTGREAIQEWYSQLFQEEPQTTLKAQIGELQIDGDSHARVRGTVEVSSGEGEPNCTSFLAELIKAEGKWLVASVEEDDPDPLSDLGWLVGDWQDEKGSPTIRSNVSWDTGGRFLVRKYSITQEEGTERTGTQYIVWDPRLSEIRTWVFDSEGAVGEGRWQQKDDHWSIHWTATLVDGRQATATQALKPVDNDAFEVQWTDIDVDGEMRPSSGVVTVRRVPEATSQPAGETDHE